MCELYWRGHFLSSQVVVLRGVFGLVSSSSGSSMFSKTDRRWFMVVFVFDFRVGIITVGIIDVHSWSEFRRFRIVFVFGFGVIIVDVHSAWSEFGRFVRIVFVFGVGVIAVGILSWNEFGHLHV
jgi:hypothetical protein